MTCNDNCCRTLEADVDLVLEADVVDLALEVSDPGLTLEEVC